jgi:cleavage stimulation factor subunit 2
MYIKGVSEEQICDIFGRCGTVAGFRLVYDKESGQPKGYGFLEFTDADAASSAVRNLNNMELNGRQLRVDYSNDNRSGMGQNAPPPSNPNNQSNGRPDPAALPPLPQGTDLPHGVTIFDGISQTLAAIPTATLLDFISQLKGLCQSNPAQATALLQQAPQLSYAVFQAMCLLGLVDPNIVAQLIQSQGLAPPPPQQAAPAPPPPVAAQYPPQPPPQQYGQYPPPQAYGNAYAPTPPTQHNAYQPPAPQAPPPQQAQAPPGQEDLIRQVLALTAEQIYAMEPSARDQILALRAQFGAPL